MGWWLNVITMIAAVWLVLCLLLALWDLIREPSRTRVNTHDHTRQDRISTIQVARSFEQKAAKGFDAKRRVELDAVVKTGERRHDAL